MDRSVLVLDAGYTALGMVSTRRGINYVLNNKGTSILDTDHIVGCDQFDMFAPSIVLLHKTASHLQRKRSKELKWSKKNVLQRDKHACGYCLGKATTIDHIQPRCRGGGNDWLNTVAACQPCNSKKDSHLLHEIGMKLLIKPYVPTHMEKRLSLSDEQTLFLVENSLEFILDR